MKNEVVSLSWWCSQSRGSSSCGRRIGIQRFSASTAARSSSCSDAEPDAEPAERSGKVYQVYWDRMFAILKSYKSTHGDTLVPATYHENQRLSNWVDNQRQLHRLRQEFEEGKITERNKHPYDRITDERMEKLNSIRFVWNTYEHSWNVRYEQLKVYAAEHGNTLVPQDGGSLGLWVAKQRRNYKVRQKGGHTYEYDHGVTKSEVILSDDRIKKLKDIGFAWDSYEVRWFERLEELKVYRANHDDTLVPKKYPPYPYLGRWVDKQRLDYKRYMARKEMEEKWGGEEDLDEVTKKEMKRLNKVSTGMTEERIRLLEAEDFIWEVFAYYWELKFEEACTFAAMNGHCAIRERTGANYNPLSGWAAIQRRNYIKYKNEEKQTTLTEERIDRLNVIGFAWELPTTRGVGKRKTTSKKRVP